MPDDKLNKSLRRLRVFLCYCHEDEAAVYALYDRLKEEDLEPWLDKQDLPAGSNWRQEIPKIVHDSDIVVVCLSKSSIKQGYVQTEIKIALEEAQEKPEGTIFIIPLRLEKCEVPRQLQDLQWVNFYEERGYDLLRKTLRLKAASLQLVVKKSPEELEQEQTEKVRLDSASSNRLDYKAQLEILSLVQNLGLVEFRTLCVELEVDYDSLGLSEDNLQNKSFELFKEMQRTTRLYELHYYVREEITKAEAKNREKDRKRQEARKKALSEIAHKKQELLPQINRAVEQLNWDEAIKLGEELISIDRYDFLHRQIIATAYNSRAAIYLSKNKNALAIADLDRAIQLDLKGEYYYQRGLAYKTKGEFETAQLDLREAVKLGFSQAETSLKDLAKEIAEREAYKKAEQEQAERVAKEKVVKELTQRIEELLPSFNKAEAHLRWDAEAHSSLSEVISLGNAILELDPSYPGISVKTANAYRERSNSYQKNNNQKLAIADLERATELDPNKSDDYHRLGILYRKEGKFELALANHSRAIDLNRKIASYYYARATTYEANKDVLDAIKDYDQASRLGDQGAEQKAKQLRSL